MTNKIRPSLLWLMLMCVTLGTLACGTKSATSTGSNSTATGSGNAAVAISVTPATTAISTGLTQQFGATVNGSTNTGVTWSVNGAQGGSPSTGTISAVGLYTAPASVPSGGSVTVTAQSTTDSGQSASAVVNILPAGTTVAVSITPTSSSVAVGASQQFNSSVSGTTNTAVTWQVNNIIGGNATVGTISSSGTYKAPGSVPSGGSTTVTAVSSYDSTKSASATVNITAAASTTPAPTPAPAPANALYVATAGSDSNPCTQAAPCADPAYAANKAAPGTTVEVAPGVYNYGSGAATFSNSGTAGNYIAVVCETRGACTIENSVTGNATVVMLSGNYLQLSGFEVMNTGSGNNLGFYVTGSNILISQNKIHQIEVDCSDLGGGGIQLANGVSNIVMDSNMIYDIGWQRSCPSSTVQFDGIIAETTGSGIQITNNIIYHVAGGWGLLYGNSSGSSGSVVISNNTVFNNANGGIAVVNGGDYSTISNNIVVDNGVVTGDCGIWTIYATDSHILMADNDVYGNAGGSFCPAGSPIMSGNISIDPALGTTFVNWQADGSGDYHEQSGSPTRSTGTSSCASGSPSYITPGVCAPGHDYDGNVRSSGTTWDIGAYQYQ